jgi:AcrR family transcriptional regulator
VTQLRGRARELQRDAVRQAIAEAATTLFLDSGYERTTMDDIAREVGISVRTAFRYVETKEETILGPMAEIGDAIAARVRAAEPGYSAWEALVHAVARFADDLAAEGETGKARSRLLATTPQLRGGLADKRRHWADAISPAVEERLGDRVVARAMVAAVLAALDVVVEHWAFGEEPIALGDLFHRVAGAVREEH